MMMKSEQGYMTPLSTSMELEDALAAPIAQDTKLSLTPLWEYVIRSQTLPESLDLDAFFETIHERLRDAEWEVRQHALRVLVDFIPLIPNHVLDEKISSVLSDLVANLGHLGPAVRKGAVDSLRAYVNHTEKTDEIIRNLVERGIEKAQENKVQTNVVLGIILSLPFLINNKLSDETITYIIHRLLDKIVKVIHQETVLRALLRIREIIGYEKFNVALTSHESYNSKKEFDLLCEVYDLHTFRNASRLSFRQSSFGSSTESERFTSYNQNKTILKQQSSLQESSESERFTQVQSSPSRYQNQNSSFRYQNFDQRFNPEVIQNKSPTHSYQEYNSNKYHHQEINQNYIKYHQDANQNESPSCSYQEFGQNNSPFRYHRDFNDQNQSPSRSDQDISHYKSSFHQDVAVHQNKTILKPYHVQESNVRTYVKTEDVLEEVPDVDLENDRVILETEIQLESGPAITMKIHEESGSRDNNEDRNRTFKVLPDSDGEDYEHLRRTPRRVRFGGEIVKLRTPDSDSNMHSDDNEATISIISGENGDKPVIEIKYIENETQTTTTTTRSLIPIPVKQTQSEPNSPIRPNLHRSKLYESSPNLSRSKRIQINKSRIPKRFNTEVKKSVETKIQIKISENTKGKPKSKSSAKDTEGKKRETKSKDVKKVDTKDRKLKGKTREVDPSTKVGLLDKPKDNNKPKLKSPMPKKEDRRIDFNPARRNSREDEFSPVPIHNEIEVLYNLTRSPSPTAKHRNEPFSFNRGSAAVQQQQQRNAQISLKDRYDETSIINTTGNYTGETRYTNEVKSRKVYSAREPGIPKQREKEEEEEEKLPDIKVSQKIGERRQHFDIITLPPNPVALKKSEDFQLQQNQALKKSEAPNESIQPQKNEPKPEIDFPSFQVYNSSLSDSFYEFADSPIPTKDSGECLTCSSSGSDTVVQEKRKMDQFSVLDERIIEDLQNMEDVRARQRGLEELLRVIQNPNIMDALQGRLPSLLYILFMAEQQPILQPIAEQTLSILFTSMNQQSLVSRLQQISLNLSKMGSPLGVRLAILLMRRIPPGLLVDQLLSDPILGAKSSKVREGALQILMTVSRIFPSTELNIPKSTKSVVAILKDKKRRVRQAALETLAALAQLSSPMAILEVANEITADWSDRDQILRVIRTRLSRKQLPTVNMNGSIRYSTPTGEPEIEWLSRGSGSLSPQHSTRNLRRFSARCPQDTNNNLGAGDEEKRKRFYSAQTESLTTNESSIDNESFDKDQNTNGFVVLENPKRFLEETKDVSESFSSEYNENKQESSMEVSGNEPNILKINYEDSQITPEAEEQKAILRIQDTQDSSFNVSQEQTTDHVSSSDGNKKAIEVIRSRRLAPESGEVAVIKSPRKFVPDSEEVLDERFITQNRFNTADGKIDPSKPVDGGRRFSLVDGLPENREEVYTTAGGQRVNYWKNNRRRQMTPGEEEEGDGSDWSRGSGEEPAGRAPTTQIWAIDPSAFGSSEKLSTANGTLRQIYLVKTNESKTAATNTPPHDYREGATNTTPYHRKPPTRGRSFSPQTRSNKQSDYDSYEELDTRRFVKTSYKREVQRIRREERVRKAYSSEHLSSVDRLRKDDAVSSGSSSGSSIRQPGNWHRDLRSGIPVPIPTDTKLRLRNRSSYKQERKGPLTIPYYPPVKSPSPQTTPEKFTVPDEQLTIGRQPFSSGSESSGYFTPPPEQTPQEVTPVITPEVSPQPEHRTPTANPERFIQIETPKRSVENFTVVDSEPETLVDDEEEEEGDDEEEEEEEEVKVKVEKIEVEEEEEEEEEQPAPDHLDDFSSREDHPTTEPVLPKSATNSLNEADFTQITYSQKHALSKSDYDIKISTHITRKTVNSAPSLNEIPPDFQTFEDEEQPPKTSLPGSVVDSLEDTEAPEDLFLSPQKVAVKKTIPKSLVRRKSCRVTNSTNVSVYPDSLRPFTKPKEAYHEVVEQLESSEWEVTVKGLQTLVRLIRHHKELVENHMHNICVLLGKQIRNLRSQVARSACLAATELFGNGKRALEMEADELAGPLLHRTADTNKFLRSDANAALDEMSANLSVPKVVSVVTYRGCNHQNAVVRCSAARLLANIVHRLGAEKVFQLPRDTRDKILVAGANMLSEGSLETRKYAKLLLGNLANHSQFHRALTEAVPASVLRHIDKSIRSLMK